MSPTIVAIPTDAELAFDDPSTVIASGVDARTGQPLLPPLPSSVLSTLASGRTLAPEEVLAIQSRMQRAGATLGVAADIDPNDIAQAGWGVVFAADDPLVPEYRRALDPLLALRKQQAGPLYREFEGANGVQPGEAARAFLARHGAAPGAVDPLAGVPYYLLVVGTPAAVPFDVQCGMDVSFAVGRLDLESLDALAAYAERLAAAETAPPRTTPPRAAFWGTRNAGDLATQRSARHLIAPIARDFTERRADWTVETAIAAAATRDALAAMLHATTPLDLLMTASHGAGYPAGALDTPAWTEQSDKQGALVTQEWDGPLVAAPLGERMLFAADAVSDDAQIDGLVALLFACYGAGTPAIDPFLPIDVTGRAAIAPIPFSARLPQRLLARGAHAVIGHVERAWTHSFLWPQAGAHQTVFTSLFRQLARGVRVGAAMDFFNDRYATLTTLLTEALRDRAAQLPNEEEVAQLWTAATDARNYVICGDPAARIALRH